MSEDWICQDCGHKNPVCASVCGKCCALRGAVSLFEEKSQQNISKVSERELSKISCTSNRKYENVLEIIATIIRVVGVITAVVFLFVGINLLQEENSYILLIFIIPTLLVSETTHAFLRVICNISNNLRDINHNN